MKTSELRENVSPEKTKPLGKVTKGSIVRFPNVTYADAIKDDLFYMVMETKNERTRLVCLSNAEMIERDEDRPVIEHESVLQIKPNV
jgi:hypothetical protein